MEVPVAAVFAVESPFAAAPDDDETASVHTLHSVLDPEPELEPAASVPVPFRRASN